MRVPIQTLHLFPILDQKLIELLKSLTPEDWNKKTRAKQWMVKDIAGHLLDGNLRTLSISRDRHFGEAPENIQSYQDLVNFLNRLNADWIKAMKRLSPVVLIDLLETTGHAYYTHLASLDPIGEAIFSVAWAGEDKSLNWFHIAREYTEKWHHQQQIREAVGKPGITTRILYFPVLDTFMQALPHHYRSTPAPEGTVVRVHITGEAGGQWSVIHKHDAWIFTEPTEAADCEIIIPGDDAWKLFTKGLSTAEAESVIQVNGHVEFGKPIFTMLAVMA